VTRPSGTTSAARGRPRNADVDRTVIETVLRLVTEGATFNALSMEGVARASGVSKATVYRRWPSKDALLFDALAAVEVPLPEPAGTSLREDLLTALQSIRQHSLAKRESALVRNMQSQIQSSPELWQRYYQTVILNRRRIVASILQRGIDQGEVRADLSADLDLLVDAVVGPLLTRSIQRPDVPIEDDLAERLVDLLTEGLRPRD
jgi:AcrR family transcriptional regulator